MSSSKDVLRITILGHVDHGKSTLVGRLLHETGNLPQQRYDEIKRTCEAQGRPFEYAYLMDALQEERDHNVTIDTAQTFFHTEKRSFVVIDAPGHKEFLKNMVTGAASADAAILLVDAAEGVREQTRRHAYLLSLLGIRKVIVFVNKLDLVKYDRYIFETLSKEVETFLDSIDIVPFAVIPGSAREGQTLSNSPDQFDWYQGKTLLQTLEDLPLESVNYEQALRLPVQDIYKWDDQRVYAGRIESGQLQVGDEVHFSPSGKSSRIQSIQRWPDEVQKAYRGQNVGLVLDEERFIERGEILHHVSAAPMAADELQVSLFWLGTTPLHVGRHYQLKLATSNVQVRVNAIEERIDSSTLNIVEKNAQQLHSPESGTVSLQLQQSIAVDLHHQHSDTGRFVLTENGIVVGGGIIREAKSAQHIKSTDDIVLDQELIDETTEVIDLRHRDGRIVVAFEDNLKQALTKKELRFLLRDGDQISQLAILASKLQLSLSLTPGDSGIEAKLSTPVTAANEHPVVASAG